MLSIKAMRSGPDGWASGQSGKAKRQTKRCALDLHKRLKQYARSANKELNWPGFFPLTPLYDGERQGPCARQPTLCGLGGGC